MSFLMLFALVPTLLGQFITAILTLFGAFTGTATTP